MEKTRGQDQVQQATQLLTHYLHCRRESEGLQACHAQHGAGSQDCTRHHAAFTTCANASMMQIVDGLVKIADKFCAQEVTAYQRCKQQGFSDELCETLDLAALQATLCIHLQHLLQYRSLAPSAPCDSVQAAGCSTPPAPRLVWSTRRQVCRNEPAGAAGAAVPALAVCGGANPAAGAAPTSTRLA